MRRSWRFSDGVLIAALAGLALLVTSSVWADILNLALNNDESSYILLAPAVAIWLTWLRRDRVRFCHPAPTPLGAAVIGVGWLLMALGRERAVDLFRDIGALLTLCGAVLAVAGPGIFIRYSAVWGALFFLIPVPGRIRHIIAVPLQQASAESTKFLLGLLGMPAERHGNLLIYNGVEVAIAEACNGMRMVAAMALIAYAFVFSFPLRPWARILLLALSPLVAILVNVVRLLPTTVLYGVTSADFARAFHDVAGWAVLLLAMGLMWLVLAVLRYLELPIASYSVREEP